MKPCTVLLSFVVLDLRTNKINEEVVASFAVVYHVSYSTGLRCYFVMVTSDDVSPEFLFKRRCKLFQSIVHTVVYHFC